MATAAQSDSVLELYSAYFNRAADAKGFTFWKNSFDTFFANADATANDAAKTLFALQKIAEDMTSASEYTALYPATQTSTKFINAVYTNLLDRDSDAGGLAFWVGHIDNATMTREQAIINIISGAKNNTTDQGKLDAALIANKNSVSKHFAEILKSDDVEVAKTAFNKGTPDTADDLTSDAATVTVANAALDTAVAKANQIQLTPAADVIDSTDGNDAFNVDYSKLQSTDVITDPSQTDADVMNVEMLQYEEKVIPTLRNIETINAKSLGNAVGFNVQNFAKATLLTLDSADNGVATVDNIASDKVVSVVTNENVKVLNVNSAPSGTTTTAVNLTAANATAITIKGSGVDQGTDVTSGTADAYVLKATAVNSVIEFFAGGGNDTLVLEDGITAKEVTYTGGDGDDTLLFIGSSSAPTITITGGNGDDNYAVSSPANTLKKLTMTGDAGEDTITVNLKGTPENTPADLVMPSANIETLVFNAEVAATEFKLDNASILSGTFLEILGDQNLKIDGNAHNFHNFGIRDSASVETAISSLKITGTGLRDVTATGSTLTGDIDLSTAKVDFIDINKIDFNSPGSSTIIGTTGTIRFDKDTEVQISTNLTDSLIIAGAANSSLTVDIAKSQTNTLKLDGGVIANNSFNVPVFTSDATNPSLFSATLNATTENLLLNGLDVSEVKTVNLIGDKHVTVSTGQYTDSADTKLDASTFTGVLSIKDGINGEVIGGTGADVLEITATTTTGIIRGGAGNDKLALSAGGINAKGIYGDAGNDTITLEGAAITGGDLIVDGGEGIDTIKLDGTSVVQPASATTLFKLFYGTSDVIDMKGMTLSSSAEGPSTPTTGNAKIDAKGITTFVGTDNTLTLKLTAVENTLSLGTSGTPATVKPITAGESAVFVDAGKGYLFISDGVAGLGANDTLIELSGISTFSSGLTFNNGDIVGIA